MNDFAHICILLQLCLRGRLLRHWSRVAAAHTLEEAGHAQGLLHKYNFNNPTNTTTQLKHKYIFNYPTKTSMHFLHKYTFKWFNTYNHKSWDTTMQVLHKYALNYSTNKSNKISFKCNFNNSPNIINYTTGLHGAKSVLPLWNSYINKKVRCQVLVRVFVRKCVTNTQMG